MKTRALLTFACLMILQLFTAVPAFAAGTADSSTETVLLLTGGFTIIIVALLFYIIVVLDGDLSGTVDLIRKVYNYVVPQPTEYVQDLGHDFDGIRELDNRIPPWFNYLFLGTVIFGIIYVLNFHVFGTSKLMYGEYADELAAADLQRKIILASEGTIDENKLVALKDAASLKSGAETFSKYCVSCHGPQAGGIVGPNLTDDYWIHGGGIKNVYTTIKKGVPAKGMITWELVFTQKQIQQVASYVLSLRGTNPPGGKKPEGNLFVESDTTAAPVQTASVKK